MATVLLLGVMGVLILLNMPIALAIGVAAFAVILYADLPLMGVVQQMVTAADSFALLAIPFFLLAGVIMERGGISRRLVDLASGVVGNVRGGLGHVSILASMLFGGISGSATADTAAIGSVLIPAMRREGYQMPFVAAMQAAAGTLGMIIPPSIVMVILGVTANISIGRMFLGGFVPGILLGGAYMVLMSWHARRHDYPRFQRPPAREIGRRLLVAVPPLGTVVIILLGIVHGVFTATEAGVAAAVYAIILALIYREIRLRDLPRMLLQTGQTTGMVMLLVATSSLFGWVMTILQLPEALSQLFLSVSNSQAYVFFAINILLVLIGTFLDPTPIIIILVPLLMPTIQRVGIDPVHFGVVFSVNMLIAQISPPAGVPLFVSCGIADVPLAKTFGPVLPFILVSFVVLMLITYVPWLVLVIPNWLMP
jgi:C4-dicarboxylate transporter, DctM subunit